MAFKLIFSDGFDQYTDGPDLLDRWSSNSSSGIVDVHTTNGRNGGGCLVIVGHTVSTPLVYSFGSGYSCGVIGFALKMYGTAPNLAMDGPLVFGVGAGRLTLAIGTDRLLRLYKGKIAGTLLATSTTALSLGVWAYLELRFYIHDTTGEYELKIDGVSEFSATSVDTRDSTTATGFDWMMFDVFRADTYIDDLYVLGDTANTAGGFLGDVAVEVFMPNAQGTYTDFTRSTGTTDWDLLDEQPASATDYVYCSTAADQVTVNFADASAGPDIKGVSLWAHCDMGSGGARDVKLLCDSGATLDASSAKRIRYDAGLMEGYLADPNTSVAWTLSGFNAAEFGVEIA